MHRLMPKNEKSKILSIFFFFISFLKIYIDTIHVVVIVELYSIQSYNNNS
jgi:hypothetical protein